MRHLRSSLKTLLIGIFISMACHVTAVAQETKKREIKLSPVYSNFEKAKDEANKLPLQIRHTVKFFAFRHSAAAYPYTNWQFTYSTAYDRPHPQDEEFTWESEVFSTQEAALDFVEKNLKSRYYFIVGFNNEHELYAKFRVIYKKSKEKAA